MSNLLASLRTSGGALEVLQQALSVVQNNVSNSSTPGYAAQRLNITAESFDTVSGTAGGIKDSGLRDSSDTFANNSVQQQLQSLGLYTSLSNGTGAIQSFFDASGTTGVSADLNHLVQSFSSWSASPSDPVAGQQVISSATTLAASVQGLSNSLQQVGSQLNEQIGSTADQINSLAAQVQQYNVNRLKEVGPDPGAEAQLQNALENLSQLVNVTAHTQTDGTVTVLAGGGSPLVIGTQLNKISASDYVDAQPTPVNAAAQPTAHILDSSGNDITGSVTGGQLGGLLETRNRVLSSIIGDGQQPGSLNLFAKGLADTVNGVLTSGKVSTQTGAAAGVPLFSYNATDATLAAGSLAVNSAITPAQLAPVDSAGTANGNANTLAALGTAPSQALGGKSLVQFFAGIASAAGSENQAAQTNQQFQTQAVSQARAVRDQISAVSLNGEATELLELQRGYQAVSRVLTTINTVLDSALSLIPQ